MTVGEFLQNNYFLLETIFSFIIVLISSMIHYHSRKMYLMSQYRGIKYFSNAFLFFALSFGGRYFLVLMERFFPAILSNLFVFIPLLFFIVYCASAGGFYLAYSLVWKYIEKGRLKDHKINVLFITIFALLIATLETLFRITGISEDLFLVTTVQSIVLLFALISHYTHKKFEAKKDTEPYLLFVSANFFLIYFIFFLGELFDVIFPLIGLIIMAIVAFLFIIVLGHVRKLTRCC